MIEFNFTVIFKYDILVNKQNISSNIAYMVVGTEYVLLNFYHLRYMILGSYLRE